MAEEVAIAEAAPYAAEAYGVAKGYIIAKIGEDTVKLADNKYKAIKNRYGKRIKETTNKFEEAVNTKFEAMESAVSNKLEKMEEGALDLFHHPSHLGYYMGDRPGKRRKSDADVPVSTPRPLMIEEAKNELIPNMFPASKTTRIVTIPAGYPFPKSGFSSKMVYKRRRRRRRSRRRKRKKYCTKRGVKALINRQAAFAGNFNESNSQLSAYWGNELLGTPSPVFGRPERGYIRFWGQPDMVSLQSYFERFTAMTPSGAYPEDNQRVLFLKNRRVKFVMHNPMNEMIQANFWWISMAMDTAATSNPIDVWANEYQQSDAQTLVNSEFTNDFHTYPTRYKQWRREFKIQKKISTLFNPGQTKTLSCKARSCQWRANDYTVADANFKSITHYIMWELKGVPTHQNTIGGAADDAVNYSPAALDVCWNINQQGAMAINNANTYESKITRETVTQGAALLPEVTAQIASV